MTDREKYQRYIGKQITWKLLVELGLIDEKPQQEARLCDLCGNPHYAKGLCFSHYTKARRGPTEPRTTEARTCDECSGTHYALGKCLSHYNKDRRRGGKPGCVKCGNANAVLFVYARDEKMYCPSCANSFQPFDQAQWQKAN